jgi:hypothetical protein
MGFLHGEWLQATAGAKIFPKMRQPDVRQIVAFIQRNLPADMIVA